MPRRLLIAALFIWCTAIVATPILTSYGGTAANAAELSYRIFSRVCHQFDSRSFHIGEYKFAVCIRCTMIYASFLLGVLFYPAVVRTRITSVTPGILLGVSLVPMGLDVLLAMFGIHESTVATRMATGLLFGSALSVVLLPALEEVVGEFLAWAVGRVGVFHLRPHQQLRKSYPSLTVENETDQ